MREIRDLKDMVDSSAKLYPDRTAYYVKEQRGGEYRPVTYRRAYSDISSLGTGLIAAGFKEEKIALIGENSYDWVCSYLAIVNGTGVVVPLDKELPPHEIANLLNRSGASAVIYGKKQEKTILSIKEDVPGLKKLISMDSDCDEGSVSLAELREAGRKAMDEGDRSFLDAEIDREAMCTLLFTSGTTGLAKGVMLSHKNISQNVYNMCKYVFIPHGEIGFSVLPMHHAYEMTCHILPAFYMGVSVAFCEGLKYIQKNICEIHASVMLGVPLIFETLYKRMMKKVASTGKLEQLRSAIELSKRYKLYNHPKIVKAMFKDIHEAFGGNIFLFIVGGAAIDPKVVEDFQAMGFPMIQGYGMTENAPIIAVNRSRYSKPSSAGNPMPATEVEIIDKDEYGVGEIITRGPSVMIGYYENPEATAEVLDEDGWLHTGDYGYFDKDGFLYISGRKKNVIVTKNGKNVFPEEVEFYLCQNDYIADALVHGVDDEKSGDTAIRAVLYPDYEKLREDLGELTDEELMRFFRKQVQNANDKMSTYKQVKRIGIRREDFIKTTTRKIKRYTPSNYDADVE